ncbi:MAG: DUF2069 domain-containing protein [Pseudomonadota bacterium]
MSRPQRGRPAAMLWLGLWFALAILFGVMVIDAWQRRAPAVVWLFWFLPLAVLLPGIFRDRLRSVAWLSFLTLLYFVAAVQRIFAEPGSPRAIVELLAVISLFLASMFYIRQRGPELRLAQDAREGELPE